MQDFVKIDDFISPNTVDVTQALNYALSIGRPVWLSNKTYNVSDTISLPEGAVLFSDGNAKLRLLVSGSAPTGQLILADSLNDFQLMGLTLSYEHTESGFVQFQDLVRVLGCAKGLLQDIHVLNGRRNAVALVNSTVISVVESDLRGTSANGVQLDNSLNCEIRDTYLGDLANFGVHVINGSSGSRFLRLRTVANGLELIGIVAGCANHLVQSCESRNTGDNGISVSGDFNRVIGNHCEGNDHSGIGVWGNNNIIDDNISRLNKQHGIAIHGVANIISDNNIVDNGQQGGGSDWAGVSVRPYPGFGSSPLGDDNVIANNFVDDTQETPTQKYGIKVVTDGNTHPTGNRLVGNKVKRFGSSAYHLNTNGDNEIL